jgi:hypothetical protein
MKTHKQAPTMYPLGLTINGDNSLYTANKVKRLVTANTGVVVYITENSDGRDLEISGVHSKAIREQVSYFARGALAALQS